MDADATDLPGLVRRFILHEGDWRAVGAEIAAHPVAALAMILGLEHWLQELSDESVEDYVETVVLMVSTTCEEMLEPTSELDTGTLRDVIGRMANVAADMTADDVLNNASLESEATEGAAFYESLRRGMAQAAAGQLHDLGSFAQYLDDDDDEISEPLRRAGERLRESTKAEVAEDIRATPTSEYVTRQRKEPTEEAQDAAFDDALGRIWSGIPDVDPEQVRAEEELLASIAAKSKNPYGDVPTDELVDTLEAQWGRGEPLYPQMVFALAERLQMTEWFLERIKSVAGIALKSKKPEPALNWDAAQAAGDLYLEALGIDPSDLDGVLGPDHPDPEPEPDVPHGPPRPLGNGEMPAHLKARIEANRADPSQLVRRDRSSKSSDE